jgi:hypothetical protein
VASSPLALRLRKQISIGSMCQEPIATDEDLFAPLHARTERSFGAIVGGLDTFQIQESKQPPVVL